jgi:hypothetical protein
VSLIASIAAVFLPWYIPSVEWALEFTEEFGEWWDGLSAEEQEDVNASVMLLEQRGPGLPFPHSSGVESSRHPRMRELRVQHHGRPYRVLYAFDPRRSAVLLIGGDKSGGDRWYETHVPIADRLYDRHLDGLRREGLLEDG